MKRLLALVMSAVMALSLTACTSGTDNSSSVPEQSSSVAEERATIRVGGLKGPTAMGLSKLMTDEAASYDFSIASAIDEITPKLVKGEIDIAAVPANLGSVLYNNTQGKVQVLAINTLGILYVVENGEQTVHSFEDLRGRTIYSSGKGATPEYALNYLLEGNGINPENEWCNDPDAVSTMSSVKL